MSDYAAYVFYVNRPDLLRRSLEAFPDTWSNLTIVNNSGGEVPEGARMGCRVYDRLVPLTYSQSMNLILKDAVSFGRDFILHFHSDAFSTNPGAVEELLNRARHYRDSERKWGCLWTHYDMLWAINPKAMLDIGGWDTTFPNYFTDCDTTRRLKLAGWECIDTCIQGIDHEGSATINADPKLKMLTAHTSGLYRGLYRAKHGGDPGEESHAFPFGNRELSWKP